MHDNHLRFRRLLAGAFAAVLILGAAACSGDDDGGAVGADSPTAAEAGGGAEAESGGDGDAGDGLDPDSDRPFDVGRDDFAQALKTATSADSAEVDGETIRLTYSEPKNDVTAGINCRVALGMRDGSDRIELVFDGETVDCDEFE